MDGATGLVDHARGLGAREASIPSSGKFKMRVEIDVEEGDSELDLSGCLGNGSEESRLQEVCPR